MFCSIGMMVFNKLAVSAFPLACTLVTAQLAFTALTVVVFCWTSIHIGSMRDCLRWCLVVPFFSGMILTSMLALSSASMTTVVTLRALSPLAALMIERFYPNPLNVSAEMFAAMMLMVLGAVVYGRALPHSDVGAIGWLVLNNLFAIGDRLLQRLMLAKDQAPVDISKTGVTLISNSLAIIPLVAVAVFRGEHQHVATVASGLGRSAWLYILCSCIASVGISYSGIWAQSLISATSFLVLINANKFFIIFIEAVLMHKKVLTAAQVAGASIVVLASVFYGHARASVEAEHAEKERRRKDVEENPEVGETVPILAAAKSAR